MITYILSASQTGQGSHCSRDECCGFSVPKLSIPVLPHTECEVRTGNSLLHMDYRSLLKHHDEDHLHFRESSCLKITRKIYNTNFTFEKGKTKTSLPSVLPQEY